MSPRHAGSEVSKLVYQRALILDGACLMSAPLVGAGPHTVTAPQALATDLQHKVDLTASEVKVAKPENGVIIAKSAAVEAKVQSPQTLSELRKQIKPHFGGRYFRNAQGVEKVAVLTEYKAAAAALGIDTLHPLILWVDEVPELAGERLD